MASNRDPRDLIPRSLYQVPSALFSSFPTSWEEMGNMMTQWAGVNRGVTVSEDNQNIYIDADLPGLNEDDIDISLHKDTLVIQANKKDKETDKNKQFHRRSQRSFYYQVQLPENVEENTEKAHYEGGVLHISFEKSKQSHMRKIQLKNKDASQNTDKTENKQPKNARKSKQKSSSKK